MFIPRHPVVENQFCSYGSQTATAAAGIGGVIAYAGSVVYLDETATNEEPIVKKMAYSASPFTPFGFLMQKVKTGYHQVHPAGFYMPGDLGSSDVIAQPSYTGAGVINGTKAVPVGVAHLGIWDTVHYTCLPLHLKWLLVSLCTPLLMRVKLPITQPLLMVLMLLEKLLLQQ